MGVKKVNKKKGNEKINSGYSTNKNENIPEYVRIKEDQIFLTFHVKPNSKKEEIIADKYEILVKSSAPPSKGKANKSILKIFSDNFDIPQSKLELVSGQKSRDKVICIYDDKNNKMLNKLKEWLRNENLIS